MLTCEPLVERKGASVVVKFLWSPLRPARGRTFLMGMTFARVFTDDATSGGGVMPGNAAEVVEVGRPFWWIPSV